MSFYDVINLDNIPKHIGIIMDGNGRWAKSKNLPRSFGHKAGSDRVIDIVEASYELGVKSLSLYAFSTENWKRPRDEISKLMELIKYYIRTQLAKINKNNVRINVFGDIEPLPESVKNEILVAVEKTKTNDKMNLNICLNYGGQDEILRACKNISKDVLDGKITTEDINKEIFDSHLYSKGQDSLDLLIRPSGELRVSNFMLWQLAYAEFYFSNILWPDFTKEELYKAIYSYQNRDRRYGGL
ncbi:isoprenyl transferase [Peptoniphilus lacrimalis]|uniref:isoprenyl transferase n=1 Tax=Peptoniphilus TaxID=162289 RepID=UPI0001DC9FE2|nr:MULTISPECIES: isoprenyl transferase [Peptoniphilus]EFK39343.1 di-trans,poly-cis-decaprenylcistransferase [Peptoniphilus sp. oral taxon 836 str. F0141]MDK7722038.1 isoprenyl transferase [Peptoniphilus lacrimalis]MDK7731716.1 isoprenyl transferase [Peptoniphilus lacrimalis]